MFTNTDEFLKDMKKGPPDGSADAGAVMDELFNDPDFKKLWDYLAKCEQVTIKLTAGPKEVDGIQRYGGYSHFDHELTINPKFPDHVANPQELADTMIHELIHAILAEAAKCGKSPLADDVLDLSHDPNAPKPKTRAKSDYAKDAKATAYMEANYGDSDSAPTTQYADENMAARKLVAGIIKRLIDKTKKASRLNQSRSSIS